MRGLIGLIGVTLALSATLQAQNPGALRASDIVTNVQSGCQSRVQQFDDWAHPGWTQGPGIVFDYPALASQVEIESISFQVIPFDPLMQQYNPAGTAVQTPTGFIPPKPDGVFVFAWYQPSPGRDYVVSRPFKGANFVDETLNRFLVPRASWYAVAYSTYSVDVRVRWTLPVVVC